MKLLCLLLSVFVLVLTAKPCCSDYDCRAQLSPQKEHAGKSAKEKECPGCSPFFTCGSCVGFIVSKPLSFNTVVVAQTASVVYSRYNQPLIQSVALSVWQPPKIG
ncbi:hypothetical protein [Mucilaginibacter celer]|uniref:hypothetical protein n=1 Tax=Mucilaginibacter celer TaxID=2305508 RepID=UPI0013CE4A14|nr:hypothetical protein [Mucilaginibacter celer]